MKMSTGYCWLFVALPGKSDSAYRQERRYVHLCTFQSLRSDNLSISRDCVSSSPPFSRTQLFCPFLRVGIGILSGEYEPSPTYSQTKLS